MGISFLYQKKEQKEYFSLQEWAQTSGDSIPFCQYMSRPRLSETIFTHIAEILRTVPVIVC